MFHTFEYVTLVIYGVPITQGSKVKTKWGMYDDNAKTLKPWREAVKTAALEAMHGRDRFTGDVGISCVFTFDRPQSHFGTGRNAGVLKPSAPKRPTGGHSGDLDKLERAIYDALTDGGVWRDDCQVAMSDASKVYVGTPGALDKPGARITVEVLP